MTNLTDAEFQEWAERIWAAVEYGGNGVRAVKAFASAYDAAKEALHHE